MTVPNGVTHQQVPNDQEGVNAILDWLSFVPKDASSPPPILPVSDPVERDIDFTPTKAPYDPRHMLAGVTSPVCPIYPPLLSQDDQVENTVFYTLYIYVY